MIPKFFPIGAPTKILLFWIYLIFGNCPKDTKWHSLVLQPGGLVEIIPSKKIHVYATIRYHPVAPGLNSVNCEHSIHLSIAFIFWQENFFKIYGEVLFLNSYNKSHFSNFLNSVFCQKSINKQKGSKEMRTRT